MVSVLATVSRLGCSQVSSAFPHPQNIHVFCLRVSCLGQPLNPVSHPGGPLSSPPPNLNTLVSDSSEFWDPKLSPLRHTQRGRGVGFWEIPV